MKYLISLFVIVAFAYSGICAFLYMRQERFLFYPTIVPSDYQYQFVQPFEEISLPVAGATLNAVLFKTENPKGVVFVLHGNGDIILHLGHIAELFAHNGYDTFIYDYRGYGKSSGTITSEAELHADSEAVYQTLLQRYPEDRVTIFAHSIGTGLGVHLAAQNHPQRLILDAPYFSMNDLIKAKLPWIPGFLLKYELRTDQWIDKVKAPVYLIHGMVDTLIPFENSERLLPLIQSEKKLFAIANGGHGNLIRFAEYSAFISEVLKAG